jgi:hypothetical protein
VLAALFAIALAEARHLSRMERARDGCWVKIEKRTEPLCSSALCSGALYDHRR